MWHPRWDEYPEIKAEIDLSEWPTDYVEFSPGLNTRVPFKCATCDHQWWTQAVKRIQKNPTGCPHCNNGYLHSDGRNSLAKMRPDVARDCTGVDPNTFTYRSSKKVDWKCHVCDHETNNRVVERVRHGCPYCSPDGKGVVHSDGRNSVAVTHPHLCADTDVDLSKYLATSNKRIDWKCHTCSHEWQTQIYVRAKNGARCGYCAMNKLHSDGRNSLANILPELAKEYQGDATKIHYGAAKRVKWKCSTCDHEWGATVDSRAKVGVGCGYCNGGRLHSDRRNSIAVVAPELAAECLDDPTEYTICSGKEARWKCSDCDHIWRAPPARRTAQGSNCPQCCNTGFSPGDPAYYYVHEILNEAGDVLYYKAGISNDWEKRLVSLSYGLPKHLSIRNVGYIHFEKGADAQWLETELKRISEIRAPRRDFDGGDELFLVNPMEYWGLGSDC